MEGVIYLFIKLTLGEVVIYVLVRDANYREK